MKILKLRFKNLNSLYGEWIIDFTNLEYVTYGIFALTGPTGAGKSTVLDAICLALYGATPRLGKITKRTNEIMSRQRGECYAEVLFESQKGKFICRWQQRRARRKAEAKLQDPQHEIADANTKELIETKKSLVNNVIEEKTGMDFDRFMRSILLAQGGFDTFLRANIEEKSKILEQITGTEIYSKISKRVHERLNCEQNKLDILNNKMSSIKILKPEEEEKKSKELSEKNKEKNKIDGKLGEIEEAIRWLGDIKDLKKEIYKINKNIEDLQSSIDEFTPKRNRLKRASEALLLEGLYKPLKEYRDQLSKSLCDLNKEKDNLPTLKRSVDKEERCLKKAEQLINKAKGDLEEEKPLIKKTTLLDKDICSKKDNIQEHRDTCIKGVKAIKYDKLKLIEKEKEQTNLKNTLSSIEKYIKENAKDKWLISGLDGIKIHLNNMSSKQNDINQKNIDFKNTEDDLNKVKKRLCKAKLNIKKYKKKLEGTNEKLKKIRCNLANLLNGKSLREYRTKTKDLYKEMAYINEVKNLKDLRSKLEDGKPCPLCGSKEHPFARGNIPTLSKIEQKIKSLEELILEAEELTRSIEEQEKNEDIIVKKLDENKTSEEILLDKKKNIERTLGELKCNLDKLKGEYDKYESEVLKNLEPFGVRKIINNQISSLYERLESRLSIWQEKNKKRGELKEEIDILGSDINSKSAVIKTKKDFLKQKLKKFRKLKKECGDIEEERIELYENKDPVYEESCLNKAITNAIEAEKKARGVYLESQYNFKEAKARIKVFKENIEDIKPPLEEKEKDFLKQLKSKDFISEDEFLNAILTEKERETLSCESKKLDDAKGDLETDLKTKNRLLEEKVDKKTTDKTLDELNQQKKQNEKFLKELEDTVFNINHELKNNSLAKDENKNILSNIEAQEKEHRRFERLDKLIGSHDGKKYRNFAQGLTFELMVSYANYQLKKMSDRYLLVRDSSAPLELNVIDNYQAGKIRSTKNLSGGESFIVSLTLALGLSKMASKKVRIDSLFLDEGFGTLDEEALEIALETLSTLQQEGKLIGIISHVSALKDRINTQISITPCPSSGRSELHGPGCRQINIK